MENILFSNYKLGQITLKNRIVMAPMTRSRAIGNIPNDLMVEYYRQRNSAGLIITEGTSPSPNGLGYARIPGLFNQQQVEGWKKITEAVHSNDGRIFVQLMHTGRIAHPLNMPEGSKIIAPSAVAAKGNMWTDQQELQPHPVPKEMTYEDIKAAINEFGKSAELAVEAGFDGIELHAANGYLLEQFINPFANKRNDEFGGSVENRLRFVLDVANKTSDLIGADKVGIRISPYGVNGDLGIYDEIEETYILLAEELKKIGLTYIHIVDHSSMGAPEVSSTIKEKIKEAFKGTIILSGNYEGKKALEDLTNNKGDLIAFGRPFISNPNLVEKIKSGKEFANPDPNTFYTPGEKGYTDYPLS